MSPSILGWKAPEVVPFDRLISWTEHDNEFIKYYSGSATYRKVFNATKPDGAQTMSLELGSVKEMARVILNGEDLGILWTPPFRVDVTNAIQDGDNTLEIEVVNLWVNRLIGDEQFEDDRKWKPGGKGTVAPDGHPDWMETYFKTGKRPVPERLTFCNWKHYTKESPLLPSGLIGPVLLKTEQGAQ